MKTTLNLNDEILKSAKRRAAQDGVTLTAFVEEALRIKLLETPDQPEYRFRPVVVTGSRPPNVDIADRDALNDVMDRA